MTRVLPLEYERPDGVAHRAGVFSTLGWAIYLGMSWTWCIGMFLPVLLVRDYGVWGWIVFAIPNVIGAAAMGWRIRSRDQSAAMFRAHRLSMLAFSFVTATFQIFFASWMFSRLGIDADDFIRATLALALIAVLFPILRAPGSARWIALFVLTVSLVCVFAEWRNGRSFYLQYYVANVEHLPPPNLAPLAVVCVFGFALCPYLDLSFHRARQQLSPLGARLAFGVGFAVFFLSMILFTLWYAWPIIFHLRTPTLDGANVLIWWIEIHFMVQLAFTIGVHWHEGAARNDRPSRDHMLLFSVGSVVVGVAASVTARHIPPRNYESGELVYRLFMGFYGLVFPAYVWLCMIPTWHSPQAPGRRSLVVFATSVVLAAPFFWLGFIDGKMFWLLPGLGIVLLARGFVPWKARVETAYNPG